MKAAYEWGALALISIVAIGAWTKWLNADAARVEADTNRLMFAGLPKQVNHVSGPFQQNPKSVWTQWIYEDRRRVYFVNGEVIKTLTSSTPLPER